LNHGFVSLGTELIIDVQPPVVLQPGERSFDNPTLGKDPELGRALVGPEHDFDDPSELFGNPVSKVPAISAICKYLAQTRKFVLEAFDNLRCSLAVMYVRLVGNNAERKSQSINDYVLFPAFDLLAAVNTPVGVDMMRSLDALRIYDAQAGAFFPADHFAHKCMKIVHNLFYDAFKLPFAEVVIHGLPRCKSPSGSCATGIRFC